jgi:hypothetical protein
MPGRATIVFVLAAVISGSSPACALIDATQEDVDNATIEYPESGFYGLNILHPSVVQVNSNEEYSLRANLGSASTLRIVVSWASPNLSVGRDGSPGSGWASSDNGGANLATELTLVALEGISDPDIRVNPTIMMGDQAEGLEIEFFENDALSPGASHMVIVMPSAAPAGGDAGPGPGPGPDDPDAG